MPPKKTISEEAFNAFKHEVERNSQYLVNQLLQKINKLEEKCNNAESKNNKKIEKLEEKHDKKIKEIEEEHRNKIEELEGEINRIECKYANKKINNNECVQKNETVRNIEVTRPIFYGNYRDIHPIDFLNRLEEYFAIKQTYIGEKIIIVGDCLRAAALNWFTTVRFQMANYDDFRKAFIDEYWSREIQIQVWSQCLSIKQIPDKENLREHFATWATKLRHLEVPRLSEQKIVKNIAKYYPGYLRAILVSVPERTILAAMKILGEEGQSQHSSCNRSIPHNTSTNNQRENQNAQNLLLNIYLMYFFFI